MVAKASGRRPTMRVSEHAEAQWTANESDDGRVRYGSRESGLS